MACTEEERGQMPLDSVPPQQVNSVEVKNVPGGAIISYKIPEDDDLLYVKATYHLDDGTVMEQKASAYSKSIEIVGIGKSKKQLVSIVTGDRSRNESQPIKVEVEPLDSPIYDILNSIEMNNDFGGIALKWDNPLKYDVVIVFDTLNVDKEFVEIDARYTNAIVGKDNLRGLPAEEIIIAVYVRDRWGNKTDRISGLYHPLYEEKLDRLKFARWNPPGIPYIQLNNDWKIEKIWDGLGAMVGTGFSWPTTTKMGDSWTMNMGQTAKLSRIKIYQRGTGAQFYTGANIREFELYGSPHPNVNEDITTWIFMGSYESFKPSGLPHLQLSDEDVAFATAGQDYMMDVSLPSIRYLRFKINKTWGNANYMQLMEIEIFGQPQ